MKIPFERTIAGAYRFAFTNVLSIIGIGWFPYLVVTALGVGLAVLLYPSVHGLWLDDRKTIDTAKLMTTIVPLIGAVLLVLLALLVAQAMVTVGLMRKALGQHPGPVFIFFSLGGQVWRLIGSYILMLLLLCGGVMLAALAIGVVGAVLNQFAQKVQPLVLGVLIFVAVLGYFYSVVRLSFFIPAVVVAEDHIGLRRSWHLGRGNFWRIFGISLIVSLPIQLAVSTISSTMMQIAMVPGLDLQPGPMTDAQSQKFVADLLDALRRVGPYYALLQILYLALLSGLTTGAVANAYKAVTGDGSADTKAVA
ncbi:MAG: hypothetical protein WDN01_01025 [Rhizomicrobium sp.]